MKATTAERAARLALDMEVALAEAREYWRWPVGEAAMKLLTTGKTVTASALLEEMQTLAEVPAQARSQVTLGLPEAISRLQKLVAEQQ